MLGIGGGGDVIGALAAARRCQQLGTEFALGGVAWERFSRDPRPGPRPLQEIVGGRPLGAHAVLADSQTATDDGVLFSEAFAARHLGAEVALIDATGGPAGAAEGVAAAAKALDCDLVLYVDIGGDAIAEGSEPGLASPLCDAIMLGAAQLLEPQLPGAIVVLGAGCDGELEPEEVLARVAALARAGSWIGTWSVTADVADEVEQAAAGSGTEASLMVVRCARGEHGPVEIRGGRRTVPISPLGALAFCFDVEASKPALPLVEAVLDTDSLDDARARLEAAGIRTELDYERDRAAEAAASGQ